MMNEYTVLLTWDDEARVWVAEGMEWFCFMDK
jgi:hypothetical protein